MKNLLLLLSIFIISCNDSSKEEEVVDSVVVEMPIIIEDSVEIPVEVSDSLKEARIKAKDSIKNTLGK